MSTLSAAFGWLLVVVCSAVRAMTPVHEHVNEGAEEQNQQ